MNVVLTIGRSAPARSTSVYLDFQRFEISRGRHRVRLWPKAFHLVAAIMCSQVRLTTGDLINHIYGEMKNGGPDYADNCISHYLWHARARLKPLGIGIKAGYGAGHYAIDLWENAPAEKVAA